MEMHRGLSLLLRKGELKTGSGSKIWRLLQRDPPEVTLLELFLSNLDRLIPCWVDWN